jgi:hypothetical protein
MEIDIYIPFYSHLGLPVEDLRKFAVGLEGFQTVEKEILAVLKQVALTGRKETVKGRKDLVDLVCLFRLPNFNWEKYQKVISKYGLAKSSATVVETLKRTTKMDELGLNVHQMAGLKRKLPLLTPPRKFI